MSAPQHSRSSRGGASRPGSQTRSGEYARVNAGRPRRSDGSPRHAAVRPSSGGSSQHASARSSAGARSPRASRQGNRTSSTARTAQRSGRRMHSAGAERSGVQPNLWTKQQCASSRPSGARDRGQARSGGGSAFASAAGSVLSWLFGVFATLVRAIGHVLGALLRTWFKLVRKSRPALIVSVCAIALVVVCTVDGVSHAGRAYSGV